LKRKNTKKKEEKGKKPFKVNITVPIISSSHKNSNRERTKSVFHHFCPGLPVSLSSVLLDNAVMEEDKIWD